VGPGDSVRAFDNVDQLNAPESPVHFVHDSGAVLTLTLEPDESQPVEPHVARVREILEEYKNTIGQDLEWLAKNDTTQEEFLASIERMQSASDAELLAVVADALLAEAAAGGGRRCGFFCRLVRNCP
jgi:hypothetical protein